MARFDDIRSLVASWRGNAHPALTFYEGRARIASLSYAELEARVAAVVGHLRDSLDVQPGDRIAVLSPNRLEVPILMVAVMHIGATVVPLNPSAPPDDWSYIVDHSRARGCFVSDDLAGKLAVDERVAVRR